MSDPFGSETLQDDNNSEVAVTLEDLVGDGRKYKDPNELAKAYHHADSYIEQLKAKQAEKDARLKVLEDMLEARNNKNAPNNANEPPAGIEPPSQGNAPKVPEADLSELVRKELEAANAQATKAKNINEAAEAMNRHYGSAAKAQEAIRQRAQDLGVSPEWLRDVAAQSPKAFLSSMGVNLNAQSNQTPGYQPEVVIRSGPNTKNFTYWEEMRKTNPKLYYSAEMRKQLMDSAKELGDKFYS